LYTFNFFQAGAAVDTKSTPQNIQDAFLNTVRREKDNVTIYLMNGAKLSGRIRSFDKFSVLLESGAQEQLIFKHAISTIQHARRPVGEHRSSHVADHGHEQGGEHTGRAEG
jgi:host factor-I protein